MLPAQLIGLNDKKFKQKASTKTIDRKILAVTKEQAENQTTKANNNCPSNLQITNTGGPGNKVPKQSNNNICIMSGNVNGLRNKRRLFDTKKGIDKKHNSYDRYLNRKKANYLKSDRQPQQNIKPLFGNKTRKFGLINSKTSCLLNC